MLKYLIIPQKLLVKNVIQRKQWQSINNLLGKQNKHSKINELKIEENILNNLKDFAEGFNNYQQISARI